jgi:hypothetical protein
LKKRTKKLLSVGVRARLRNDAPVAAGAGAKVFCFFFSKKGLSYGVSGCSI